MFKINDWVLTPAGKRLMVVAIITAGTMSRALLSDKSVYDVKVLKSAN
jgi:hypothetical protein